MINYAEKGHGLHDAIRAAGHWLRQENGVWVASNEAVVQAIIDDYALSEAQTYRCAEVEALAKSLRDKAIKAVSPGEMASWPIKLAEAQAYAVNNQAACPLLTAEAAARGVSLADMVTKVDSNASVFSVLEATISGTCGKHRDAIKALTTFEEVSAYDFSSGWPVV
jgi:hypothetical protein